LVSSRNLIYRFSGRNVKLHARRCIAGKDTGLQDNLETWFLGLFPLCNPAVESIVPGQFYRRSVRLWNTR
jgi:hypothetical protein